MNYLEWALFTTEGLIYNVPALIVLAWLTIRRAEIGLPLIVVVYYCVIVPVLDFSGHAIVAGAALVALPTWWERCAGLALAVFTAWYQFAWGQYSDFDIGLILGIGLGLLSLGIRLAYDTFFAE